MKSLLEKKGGGLVFTTLRELTPPKNSYEEGGMGLCHKSLWFKLWSDNVLHLPYSGLKIYFLYFLSYFLNFVHIFHIQSGGSSFTAHAHITGARENFEFFRTLKKWLRYRFKNTPLFILLLLPHEPLLLAHN